jgi:sterol desaturase/sphingolipid hydroxylase (fatty acid hydroxylase superfamily)
VFVSPILHRWHHTSAGEGCDKNFGEALAIWDVMFGTFYFPKRIPVETGLTDPPPPGVLAHMLYPLRYFLPPGKATVPAE